MAAVRLKALRVDDELDLRKGERGEGGDARAHHRVDPLGGGDHRDAHTVTIPRGAARVLP